MPETQPLRKAIEMASGLAIRWHDRPGFGCVPACTAEYCPIVETAAGELAAALEAYAAEHRLDDDESRRGALTLAKADGEQEGTALNQETRAARWMIRAGGIIVAGGGAWFGFYMAGIPPAGVLPGLEHGGWPARYAQLVIVAWWVLLTVVIAGALYGSFRWASRIGDGQEGHNDQR